MKQKKKERKKEKNRNKTYKTFLKWQFGQFLSLPNAFWEN
jgi:hypothetical protein